ncbi:MAG: septum formation initiator family protein [bacterium]|nr:septum formation initiator family protein [bacterium]
MNQALIRHNDYYAINRGRDARKQVATSSRFIRKFIAIILSLLFTVLLHQYLHTQITVTKSQIAAGQKTTQDLQNRERFLAQEIESLKHPQRIERLASALGMFPPREVHKKKFYNVHYASFPAFAGMTSSLRRQGSAEPSRLSKGLGTLVTKLVTYYQRAEAKPNK